MKYHTHEGCGFLFQRDVPDVSGLTVSPEAFVCSSQTVPPLPGVTFWFAVLSKHLGFFLTPLGFRKGAKTDFMTRLLTLYPKSPNILPSERQGGIHPQGQAAGVFYRSEYKKFRGPKKAQLVNGSGWQLEDDLAVGGLDSDAL